MSGSAPDLAAELTRVWVRLYTRGLPADLRAARRDELESDLWEHRRWRTAENRRPGRVALEIMERLFAGMAADLSWRLEHRGARRQMTRPVGGGTVIGLLKKHGMVALTVALGAMTASLAIVGEAFGEVERSQVAALFVAGLLILGGLVAMRGGLRGGRIAVALGAIVPGMLLVWTIIMPIITLAILVWLYAGRRPRQAPVQTT